MDEQQEKKIISLLQSLKKEKAPADFLAQVHARIEKRSRLAEIIDALFQPVPLKLPIKLASSAIVVVFFLLIFKTLTPELPIMPSSSQYHLSVVHLPKTILAKKSSQFQTLTLALTLDEGMVGVKDSDNMIASGTVNAAPQVTDQERPAKGYSVATKAEEDALAGEKADKYAAPTIVINNKATQTAAESNLNRLTNLVKQAAGKIVLIERNKENGAAKALVAKIPARSLSPFLEEIKKLGQITIPSIPAFNGKYILVRIDLFYQ